VSLSNNDQMYKVNLLLGINQGDFPFHRFFDEG